MVVVCIMVFNIIWLLTILENDDRVAANKKKNEPLTSAADYAPLDYQALLLQEIQPHCKRRRTLLDIQNCFPLQRKLPPHCHSIQDWNDVQRCLTGRFRDDTVVHHVHIVGERHSGTKFLTQELQDCFPRKTRYPFRVHRDFIRSKHFFQPILSGHDLRSSVVIVVVRDPVDWTAAMHEKPYHSPHHVAGWNETHAIPLDWRDFVQRPWTLSSNQDATSWEGKPHHQQQQQSLDDNTCQYTFHRREVVPCEFNETSGKLADRWVRGFAPVYELQRDGSGRAFSSILELRTEKILNFVLELPILTDLSGFLIVRYEDMMRNGTNFVLEQLRQILGLDAEAIAKCHVVPPQPERMASRPVPPEFRQYIWDHLDTSMERLLGYG